MKQALLVLLLFAAPASAAGLHSRPESSQHLLLDFDGNPADGTPAWGTPAQRSAVWSAVAGYFSFVNLDVTTDYSQPLTARTAAAVEIGDVPGYSVGGYAFIRSWDWDGAIAHVFPYTLSENQTYIARAVAHEAGHVFGLQHQSVWDGTKLIAEYDPGTAVVAPIMGLPYYAAKADWWVGPTPVGAAYVQDDRAVLLSVLGASPGVPEPCYGLAVVGVLAGRRRKGAK